jgi:hypothetical protein
VRDLAPLAADNTDPFAEGIVFSVRPPKKSWKNIANLSGGEKTLSSLALVFALHHYKPTPFYGVHLPTPTPTPTAGHEPTPEPQPDQSPRLATPCHALPRGAAAVVAALTAVDVPPLPLAAHAADACVALAAVMDEIDAALDFRNVSIVGNYIKERTRNAQFVIISLRNNMFELADRLVRISSHPLPSHPLPSHLIPSHPISSQVGIYKTDNATKAVAIDPAAFTVAAH